MRIWRLKPKPHLDGLPFVGQPLGQGVIGHHGPHPWPRRPPQTVLGDRRTGHRDRICSLPQGLWASSPSFWGPAPAKCFTTVTTPPCLYRRSPLEALDVGLDQRFGKQVVFTEGTVDGPQRGSVARSAWGEGPRECRRPGTPDGRCRQSAAPGRHRRWRRAPGSPATGRRPRRRCWWRWDHG